MTLISYKIQRTRLLCSSAVSLFADSIDPVNTRTHTRIRMREDALTGVIFRDLSRPRFTGSDLFTNWTLHQMLREPGEVTHVVMSREQITILHSS